MKNKVNESGRRREGVSRERDMERQWKDKARQGNKTNTERVKRHGKTMERQSKIRG